MKHHVLLKKVLGLLAIAGIVALSFAACQPAPEPPAKEQTTNAPAPAKAPEHPEHPK
jgi:hypothetical protein